MRVTQHHITSKPVSRTLVAAGALFLALTISGCSAVSMSGFDFPVFGLTKDSGEDSDAVSTSTVPADQSQPRVQAERLTNQ